MRLIHFASPVFDELGCVSGVLTAGTRTQQYTKRITKTATLDGSASIVDFGLCEADREFAFKILLASQTHYHGLMRLITLYPAVLCSFSDGLFLGHVASVNLDVDAIVELSYYVKTRLA